MTPDIQWADVTQQVCRSKLKRSDGWVICVAVLDQDSLDQFIRNIAMQAGTHLNHSALILTE